MKALALTFADQPTAMNMSLQRQYFEPYDWVLIQFKDWAYNLLGSFLYYEDYDRLDENERALYRQGISAFGSHFFPRIISRCWIDPRLSGIFTLLRWRYR